MENLPNQAEPLKTRITFMNLLKGNIPLPTTYWVFGCIVMLILRLIDKAIQYNYWSLRFKYEMFVPLTFAFFWIQITYSLFISICIWNSALKYKGKRIWAGLAMMIAVIVFIGAISNILECGNPSRTDLENEIRIINAGLPVKVDDETEFEGIELIDESIIYSYKRINVLLADVDVDNKIVAKLKQNACSVKENRILLGKVKTLKYVYKDKVDSILFEVIIERQDCQ
ncbi:MAG TPA: hypothetical protein VNK03_02495 [Gammaproteobacteria bacterium]|nr:hypothetical protein [Gammaproteobacteria bacterium]